MKFVICGLGAVGTSFLILLKDNGYLNPSIFYCVDQDKKVEERFIQIGGFKSHFFNEKISKDNIDEFLYKLNENDFLIDFTSDIKNLYVLQYCLDNGIHYLSTADSSWKLDPLWLSCHQHFLEYLKIKKSAPKNGNTCLIEFGMNPGMISCYVKKCIKEIINNDRKFYISTRRKKLKQLLAKNEFGRICKLIGVKHIQEVDNDNQEFSIPYTENTLYSTWCPWAYYYETVSFPEIAFGTKNEFYGYNNPKDCDIDDLFLMLNKSAFKYQTQVFSPQGYVIGHISTHEEIFSIRNFLSYKNYKPTVYFVYSPSEYALNSIKQFEFNTPTNTHLLKKEEIFNGGESVGVVIEGSRFKPRYYGNFLKTENCNESATILQVSVSAYSAFIYILNHPKSGLLFPEDVDDDEIISTAEQYLANNISVECPKYKTNLNKFKI